MGCSGEEGGRLDAYAAAIRFLAEALIPFHE